MRVGESDKVSSVPTCPGNSGWRIWAHHPKAMLSSELCVQEGREHIVLVRVENNTTTAPRKPMHQDSHKREATLHACHTASQAASEQRLDKPPKRGHAPPSPMLLQGGSRVSCTTVLTSADSEGAESLPRQKSSQGWSHSSRAAGGTLLLTTCNYQLCSKQP